MDQLSRNEELQAQLKDTEWDLIIVDEAHRMGAHYFGGKLEKTKRFLLGELLGEHHPPPPADDRDPALGQGGGLPALPHSARP